MAGTKGEARSAATVAALVGGLGRREALRVAIASFRALPWAQLAESDLASSADSGVATRAVPDWGWHRASPLRASRSLA